MNWKYSSWDFPGGAVVKNPPASAGDKGSIPCPTCHGATKAVRHNHWVSALEPASHNCWAHVPQQLKPACRRARVPQLLSPCAATTEACTTRARGPQQEKPPQWEARTLQQRVAPARHN